MMRSWIGSLTLIATLATVAHAQQWGDLSGQFVYDGTPPTPAKITPTKDVQFCSKHPLLDETLMVSKDGGVANIVIYLRPNTGEEVPVHPDYEKLPEMVKFDNMHCRFTPHVLPLWIGHQSVALHNSDEVGHNTNLQPLKNMGINVLLPAGAETDYKFEVAENIPVGVSCNIHPWMKGWIVPRDNPYVAVTDEAGKFTIKNVPAGEWRFQVWHEKAGYVSPGSKDWSRGRFEMEIKSGKNDLGVVKLEPAVFEK